MANAEQAERQKDRELLLQLSAELSRLRAESEALKKAQTDAQSQGVALPVKPQSAPATPVGSQEPSPTAARIERAGGRESSWALARGRK